MFYLIIKYKLLYQNTVNKYSTYTLNKHISDLNVSVYLVQQVSSVRLILMNVIAIHVNGVLVKIKSMVLFVLVKMVMKADFVK